MVTDLAGNTVTCDPVITLVQRSTTTDPQATKSLVDQAENKLLILNSTPGLKNLEVTVNGTKLKVTGLKDGENRTLDLSRAMVPGSKNSITVKGHGPVNSSAMVVVSDGSVQ